MFWKHSNRKRLVAIAAVCLILTCAVFDFAPMGFALSESETEVVIPEGKTIYLTFDDGPGKYTEKLLETLKKYNAKATFFVTDTRYIHLLADIAEDGHAIGVHSASHVYKEIYASEEAYFRDFEIMYNKIYELTGIRTTLVRFPGGSSNRVSRFCPGIMTRLTKLVKEYGFQYFDWNVDSFDSVSATTAQQVYRNVISKVSGKQCSIVLQHDIYGYSVDAVEKILQWGLANGYQFLSLEATSPGFHQTVVN